VARLVTITVNGIARVIDLMRGNQGPVPTLGYNYVAYSTGPYGG
jgi:hypothetical protein